MDTCFAYGQNPSQLPGYMTEGSLRARAESMVAEAERRASAGSGGGFHQPTFEEVVDKGYVIVGSPDAVSDKLRELNGDGWRSAVDERRIEVNRSARNASMT